MPMVNLDAEVHLDAEG